MFDVKHMNASYCEFDVIGLAASWVLCGWVGLAGLLARWSAGWCAWYFKALAQFALRFVMDLKPIVVTFARFLGNDLRPADPNVGVVRTSHLEAWVFICAGTFVAFASKLVSFGSEESP